MTESIKVLGRTLNLLPGTSRPHYVSSGEGFPYLYAWAPDLVKYWEVGATLPDRSDCQGRGITLEEAEKSFVVALAKYNEEAQKLVDKVNNLLSGSPGPKLTTGPTNVEVNGIIFIKDETKTVKSSACLIEVYDNSFNFSLERTHYLEPAEYIGWRAARGSGKNRMSGRDFLTPNGAIDCTFNRVQEELEVAIVTLDSLCEQTKDVQKNMNELLSISKDLSYVSKHK